MISGRPRKEFDRRTIAQPRKLKRRPENQCHATWPQKVNKFSPCLLRNSLAVTIAGPGGHIRLSIYSDRTDCHLQLTK